MAMAPRGKLSVDYTTSVSLLLAVAIISTLAVLCFINSIDGEFVFDDSEAIVTNQDLNDDVPLTEIFHNDFWGGKITKNTSHKSYRPLTVLTFRWNHWVAGELNPWGFHLLNVILHTVVSVLVLCMFSVLFNDLVYDTIEVLLPSRVGWRSFVGAVIFAVHPIHTESVSGCVGRTELLSAVLFILAFLCYSLSCNTHSISRSILYLTISLILSACSMLSKEQGVTVIGVCVVYDILLYCKLHPRTLLTMLTDVRSISTSQPFPNWLARLLMRQAILFAGAMLILAARWHVMGSGMPTFMPVDNPASFASNFFTRVLNYNYVYALNAWILVHPFWLCFDWSMGCVPLIEAISDYRVLAPLLLWSNLTAIVCYCVRTRHLYSRLVLMSVAMVIVPFLPASNVFFRVGFVVAERVLYIPSIGYSMLLTLGLSKIYSNVNGKLKKCVDIGVVSLVLVLSVRSINRSSDWLTEKQLYTAGALVCPLNAKVHYNIGKILSDMGNTEGAVLEYRQAITLNEEYAQPMNNLGNILKDNGEFEKAEGLLLDAVEYSPEFAAAWMNLGIVQTSLNKYQEAEKSYHTAITHRKNYPDCYYNLGNLYRQLGRPGDAINAWRSSIELKSTHALSWGNYIQLLDDLGHHEDALAACEEAMSLMPDDSKIHFLLGNIYGKLDQLEDAERYLKMAIRLNDSQANYYGNLGVVYHKWQRYDKAEEYYGMSLKMEPDQPIMWENVKKLRRSASKSTNRTT